MNSERPIGRPYSQVYVDRGLAKDDSVRFRARLSGYIRNQPQVQRLHVLLDKRLVLTFMITMWRSSSSNAL